MEDLDFHANFHFTSKINPKDSTIISKMHINDHEVSSVVFSDCRQYRYLLRRCWGDPKVMKAQEDRIKLNGEREDICQGSRFVKSAKTPTGRTGHTPAVVSPI